MTNQNLKYQNQIEEIYTLFLASTGVCTDTRKLEKDNLYFALKGDNFDGNKFAGRALEQGAIGVVVDDSKIYSELSDSSVLASDTLRTLQDVAKHHRQQLNIPVIAITGSNGKTTTKEILHEVLSTEYRVYATKGNYNNHIGVPLTLLTISQDTEIAIVEMGANHLEEIDFLCNMALPTHGFITNIGKAHLEGFGSFENIKKGKSELYRYLADSGGKVFIQQEDIVLKGLLELNQSIVPLLKESDFKILASFPKLKFEYKGNKIKTNLTGRYNMGNIAAALGIGKYFNVDVAKSIAAVENYAPNNNRSQIFEQEDITYILDSYNANPSSMQESVDNVSHGDPSNTALIIGDMKELGAFEKEEHMKLLDHISSIDWGAIYTVGDVFFNLIENIYPAYENVDTLKEHLKDSPLQQKIVLLKGSRSIALEKLIEK